MVVKLHQNKSQVNAGNTRFSPYTHRYIAYTLCIGVFFQCSMPIKVYAEDDMALIDKGFYAPLFKSNDAPSAIEVASFYMDQYPITNEQFHSFTKQHTKWDKGKIKPIFGDRNFLKQFSEGNMNDIAKQPVTNVSWFAARAYCRSVDKRLPTTDEWEYVAKASHDLADGSEQAGYRQQILEWYSKPAGNLPNIDETQANYWKVYAMHGVVWELVSDFNTALVTGESRGDTQLDKQLFCGAGAASSVDPNDYAAFMRYAMRSSYSAHYTIESLGFRCAKDITTRDITKDNEAER